MTYHIEPWVEKIESPVVLAFTDGRRWEYADGISIKEQVFYEKYVIEAF